MTQIIIGLISVTRDWILVYKAMLDLYFQTIAKNTVQTYTGHLKKLFIASFWGLKRVKHTRVIDLVTITSMYTARLNIFTHRKYRLCKKEQYEFMVISSHVLTHFIFNLRVYLISITRYFDLGLKNKEPKSTDY